LTGLEDSVGMLQRNTSSLGQFQSSVFSLKERMAKSILQLSQLYRQRRGRDVKCFSGFGELPVVRYSPEVAQVVKVQICHFIV
jgi:hypothetical protein